MFIKETVDQSIEIVTGFICSKCKKEITDDLQIQESLIWSDVGGYCSYFGDGCTITIHLCPDCLYEMFKEIAEVE